MRTDGRVRLCAAFVAFALIAACAGCATTQVKRADQLGTLGKAYVEAVAAVSDEAMAASTSFSLSELAKERRGGAFPNADERTRALTTQIDTLKARQALVATSNQQLALVQEYFVTLQSFANQDIGGSVEAATGDLTKSINEFGKAIEKDPQAKATISDDEATAISKLSGVVAQQIHGAVLAGILRRDAPLIGRQLKILSKTVATYSSWIRTRADIEFAEAYRTRVLKPFVADAPLPDSWEGDVRDYLRGRQLSEQLGKAELAAQKMERFWAEYLAGRTSLAELTDDLNDLKKLLDAVAAVRTARASGGS
jgi:hypothetical protein